MNNILKILSILIIGFVMFSCSTPTNDPETPYVPEPSSPETSEVQTYSITFTTDDSDIQIFVDYLNTLPEFKNLEKGTKVKLYKHLYTDNYNGNVTKITKEIVETSELNWFFFYDSEPGIDSVVIGNEDIEIKLIYGIFTDDLNDDYLHYFSSVR